MQQKVVRLRRAGRPTQGEAERLNDEIVQAALDVFVRVGFSGASMEQVVQESGATRRSVVHRFADKEALLLAVVDARMHRLVTSVIEPEAMLSAKPLETLRDSCSLMYQGVLASDYVEFYRLCIAEAARFPGISARFIAFNDRLASDLEGLVMRAQRAGAFNGMKPSTIATSLIGVFISNPLNRLTLGDPQFSSAQFRHSYFQEMWELVIAHARGQA